MTIDTNRNDTGHHLVLIEYYEAVRNEIVQRLRLRDNVTSIYLAGLVGVVGIVGSDKFLQLESNILTHHALLLIPFLSAVMASIITGHTAVMGGLTDYVRDELEPALKEVCGVSLPSWDSSQSYSHYNSRRFKSVSNLLLYTFPANAAAAMYTYQNWPALWRAGAWVSGVIWNGRPSLEPWPDADSVLAVLGTVSAFGLAYLAGRLVSRRSVPRRKG